MNDWTILGIEKTNDLRKVKQAYAEKTKLYHPETHPEEFQILHNAYRRIVAEIRGGADHQQQIQVPLPLEMNFQKEVHKPVRDTKQDVDFLKLVEEAAENFEARHTDKRDPVQVAKVEYILQHDARNSKLLRQFQWMLYNEFFAKDWRNFFINKEFLERQYEPEFINGMTEILKSRLLEMQRAKKGVYGNIGILVYFIVVYGAIFEGIDHLQFDKHIYRKGSLRGLVDMFPSNADKRDSYRLIEENAELMGERYAFFLYRSILEELDKDIPAKEKIMEVIIEGFQKENISKVFFDLLLYLVASNRKNIPVFKDALAQVCKMEWDSSIQDEIEILRLDLTF
ncbi:MAG: J domain-containing protein [Acetatifactor sp.]|nr:J domain-containing protein [Acetatifactor sp.]